LRGFLYAETLLRTKLIRDPKLTLHRWVKHLSPLINDGSMKNCQQPHWQIQAETSRLDSRLGFKMAVAEGWAAGGEHGAHWGQRLPLGASIL